jgi:hypothetical protein
MNEIASGSSGLPSSFRFSRSASQFETIDEMEDFSLLPCPPALPRLAKLLQSFCPLPPGGKQQFLGSSNVGVNEKTDSIAQT